MNEKIKDLRLSLRLTQEAFGKELNVKRAVIAQIETGKNKPTADLLRKIYEVFGVDVIKDSDDNNKNYHIDYHKLYPKNSKEVSFEEQLKNRIKLLDRIWQYKEKAIDTTKEEHIYELLQNDKYINFHLGTFLEYYSDEFSEYEINLMAKASQTDYKQFKKYFDKKVNHLLIYKEEVKSLRNALERFIEAIKRTDPQAKDMF